MASSCQNCGETDKTKFILEVTGERFNDLGPAMVAGVQEKRLMLKVWTASLTCTSCDTTWHGTTDSDYFFPDLVAQPEVV